MQRLLPANYVYGTVPFYYKFRRAAAWAQGSVGDLRRNTAVLAMENSMKNLIACASTLILGLFATASLAGYADDRAESRTYPIAT